jgi:hypothetical protein
MKTLLALALSACACGSALAQASVNLSVGINEPGVYGQINIGTPPPPVALVAPQPVVVAPAAVAVAPAYLYVPLLEQRNWRRYCAKYAACGRPVYFVREDWVRERYVHEHPEWERAHPRGGVVAHRPEERHDERRAEHHDERERHD